MKKQVLKLASTQAALILILLTFKMTYSQNKSFYTIKKQKMNNIKKCTNTQISDWEKIEKNQQGISAKDPYKSEINDVPAEWKTQVGSSGINNWYPLFKHKQTLCGKVYDFGVYGEPGGRDASAISAENDWNIYLLHSPPFKFFMDESLKYKNNKAGHACSAIQRDGWKKTTDGKYLIEAEITPDEDFYNNPWFNNLTGKTNRLKKNICVYGPAVRECVHKFRPEIHPSEMLWWKENNTYTMLLVQDDSNRFDSKKGFDDNYQKNVKNKNWKPWAEPPMGGVFKIAYRKEIISKNHTNLSKRSTLVFDISTPYNKHVYTSTSNSLKQDNNAGRVQKLYYDNFIHVKANENQQRDDDLGVKFVDNCLVTKQNKKYLQGYLQISTRVGSNDIRGGEGFQAIKVKTSKETPGDLIYIPPSKKTKKEVKFIGAKYVGDAPGFVQTNYSSRIQGISNNKDYWFFTQLTKIKKIPLSFDLKKDAHDSNLTGVKTTFIPKFLKDKGYNHFGDPDNMDGYLFVSIEKEGSNNKNAIIAVFRESDLKFIDYTVLEKGKHKIGWVSINPINKNLYTSENTITRKKPILQYAIDWKKLKRNKKLILKKLAPFHFNYESLPKDWGFQGFGSYMQGGDFSDDGNFLFLTNGKTFVKGGGTKSRGLHILKVINNNKGKWLKSSTQSGNNGLKYKYNSKTQEPEGLTYLDLTADNRIKNSKMRGQVHTILYGRTLKLKGTSKHLMKHFFINTKKK